MVKSCHLWQAHQNCNPQQPLLDRNWPMSPVGNRSSWIFSPQRRNIPFDRRLLQVCGSETKEHKDCKRENTTAERDVLNVRYTNYHGLRSRTSIRQRGTSKVFLRQGHRSCTFFSVVSPLQWSSRKGHTENQVIHKSFGGRRGLRICTA